MAIYTNSPVSPPQRCPEDDSGGQALQSTHQGGEEGRCPGLRSGGNQGLSSQCMREGSQSIVQHLLLRYEIDINTDPAEAEGRTALQAACDRGHGSIVELLLQAGANINPPPQRVTALHAAKQGRHMEIVEVLKEAEATYDDVCIPGSERVAQDILN